MEVSGLSKITDLKPFVLRNIINFTFFACFIRLFGSNGVDQIFGLVLEFSVEMGQLVAASRHLHVRSFLDFVGLLIDDKGLSRVNASDIVFFLFPSNNEDFILSLDTCEFVWKEVRVSQLNSLGVLSAQFVDIQIFVSLIEIMESLLRLRQDVVRFETNDIVEEPSEFVDFTLDLDIGSGVLLEEGLMVTDLSLETRQLLTIVFINASLLQDLQEFVCPHQILEGSYRFSYFYIKLFQLG